MLSAHEPYKDSPTLIKAAIKEAGGVAQFAGGVPAMCDGVTQGQSGMELSLCITRCKTVRQITTSQS
jgi:phosphogluconate dehydratase